MKKFSDPLFGKVLEFIKTVDNVSGSLLQRNFEIGYPRAGKIIDELERRNLIGYTTGNNEGRKVLKDNLTDIDTMIQEFENISPKDLDINAETKKFIEENEINDIHNLIDISKKLTPKQINKIKYFFDEGHDLDIDDILHDKGKTDILKEEVSSYKKQIKVLQKERYEMKELLFDLKDSIKEFNPDNIKIDVKININKKNNLNSILLLSDIHYGEIIDPIGINNLNEYNCEIAKKRLEKLFVESIKQCKYTGANKGFLFMLGDMLTGIIHDELAENSEKVITKLIIDLSSYLSGLIDEYAKNFDTLDIVCVGGNHAAIRGKDGKVQFKNKGTKNFEFILYHIIENKLFGKNIKFINSESPFYVYNIGDLRWYLEHGDSHRGGNGFNTMPYNTVSRDVVKDFMMLRHIDKEYDVLAQGHFHVGGISYTSDGIPLIFNPSVVGGNEFSIFGLHSNFPASQYSIIQDENKIKQAQLITLN